MPITVPATRRTGSYGVLLVEDDTVMRDYLATAVGGHPELRLLAGCADIAGARAALDKLVPDVLLTDLALPDGDGLTLIREVKRDTPSCECMVISVFGTEARVIAAIEAGATGYLLKDDPYERVGEAILSLIRGGSPMSPGIARHVLKRFHAPAAIPDVTLTEREQVVLNALARGFTYAEISAQLSLSEHTVGTHIKHIYCKLEVRSRSEAVFEAVQMGLIRMQ